MKENKHAGGRPSKYEEGFPEQAYKLCAEKGFTDKQLAAKFKISVSRLYVWKREFPEFQESIKRGKDEFDAQVVEQSLLKRALGYRYTETTREPAIVSRRGVIDGEGIGRRGIC